MSTANPMILIESRYLQQKFAVSWRWRMLLLLLILPIVTIPFHTYITPDTYRTDDNTHWLYLMMAVTLGLQ